MKISSEGIESPDDKGNPTHATWDNFIKLGETSSLYALYLSPLLPLLIPKRLVKSEEQADLKDLITRSLQATSNSNS